MKIIHNASARLEGNTLAIANLNANLDRLANDVEWQATLAAIMERP